jgi:transcriptional regulator with XRE-family HTH domain
MPGIDDQRPATSRPALAEKLNALIVRTWPDERRRPGMRNIAQQIAEASGGSLSGTYLWSLSTGKANNPTVQQVEALARFFGVAPSYFFDDAITEEIDADRQLVTMLRDRGILNVALRTDGLSPRSVRAIVEMIDRAREIERLDPIDPTRD